MDKKCIQMLKRADNDNDRLAAMMMVPRLLKHEDCSSEVVSRLYHAIGHDFMIRLLRSENVPEGCTLHQYKQVAMSVLSCFITEPTLLEDSSMLKIIPYLTDVINLTDSIADDEGDLEMLNDAYTIINVCSKYKSTRSVMISANMISTLTHIVVKQLTNCSKACDILFFLIQQCNDDTWKYNKSSVETLIKHLVESMKSDQSMNRFTICDQVFVVLQTCHKEFFTTETDWCWDLHAIVFGILRSKVGATQRNTALHLCAIMIDLFSCTWLAGRNGKDIKLVALLTNLVDIEVQMILNDVDITQLESQSGHLLCVLSLLESLTSYMNTADDDNVDDMRGIVTLVTSYSYISKLLCSIQQSAPQLLSHPILTACIRCYGSFLSDGGGECNIDATCDVMPTLIYASNRYITNVTQVPAVVTENKQVRFEHDTDGDTACRTHNDGSDIDVVRFLLPGLCHLTAEPRLRLTFTKHKGHHMIQEYVNLQWKKFIATYNPEIEDTLNVCCSILHNITLEDSSLVCQDQCFVSIFNWTLSSLSVLEHKTEYLTLSFNMVLLGLLLARLLHKSSSTPTDKFYTEVIRLISHAYHLSRDSGDGGSFIVNESYVPHWECLEDLWMLSMQTFSECIPLFPNICKLLLKSGWILTILKSLKALKGHHTIEHPVIQQYSQLLAACCKSDPTIKKIACEKGAIELAGTLNMASLQGALMST